MKTFLVYFVAFLMLITSTLYFGVAIFGEKVESSEAHFLQLVEGQLEDETTHNESQQLRSEQDEIGESHNETEESTAEQLQEAQVGESTKHVESREETESHQETASEKQHKMLEFPLSLSAGVGYAVVGLWMIFDKRNRKITYVIAIVGSLVLLGIYSASRTVSISSLGVEPVGLLDLIVAMLQGGIIISSAYILVTKVYTITE